MRRPRSLLAAGALAASLLAPPGPAAAEIPTGSFEIAFGGPQSIWLGDADSGEEFCAGFAGGFDDLEFCSYQAFLDGKGRIFGTLEFSGWSGGLHFAESGPIKGTQKGDDRSGISRVLLTIKLTGVASDGFATAPSKSSLRLSAQTTAGGVVSGVWDQSVCVKGLGCSTGQSPVPPTVLTAGGWRLELEIGDGGGGALDGAARVVFEAGGECAYAVSGKYSAKKDLASLNLLPTQPGCAGTSLRSKDIRVLSGAPDVLVGTIAYSLFGFTGTARMLPLPLQGLPGTSANQQIFDLVCAGTVAIAASIDPSACVWSVTGRP